MSAEEENVETGAGETADSVPDKAEMSTGEKRSAEEAVGEDEGEDTGEVEGGEKRRRVEDVGEIEGDEEDEEEDNLEDARREVEREVDEDIERSPAPEDDAGDGEEAPARSRNPPEASEFVTPDSLNSLRACKRCGLIKTFTQFYDIGCENCPFFDMEESNERVGDCTTAFFGGTCSIIDPTSSWMAKWLRLSKVKAGVYAIRVQGSLTPEVQHLLESRNLKWRVKP